MTEPRKPLVLDFLEWKTLVMHGLAEMGQAIQGSQTIDAGGVQWADAKWQDIRTRLVGWENYSRPVLAQQKQQALEQEHGPVPPPPNPSLQQAEAQVNGAADPPKKKGGWVKGRPRKPKAVAPPAVTM